MAVWSAMMWPSSIQTGVSALYAENGFKVLSSVRIKDIACYVETNRKERKVLTYTQSDYKGKITFVGTRSESHQLRCSSPTTTPFGPFGSHQMESLFRLSVRRSKKDEQTNRKKYSEGKNPYRHWITLYRKNSEYLTSLRSIFQCQQPSLHCKKPPLWAPFLYSSVLGGSPEIFTMLHMVNDGDAFFILLFPLS